MKALLLSLLLLVGLASCQFVPPTTFTQVTNGVQINGTADNCVYSYWQYTAAPAVPGYLFITIVDGDGSMTQGVAFYVGLGFTPSASNKTASCNTLGNNPGTCTIRIDCGYAPGVFTFATTETWSTTATNNTSPFNFTVWAAAVPVTDITNLTPAQRSFIGQNISTNNSQPYPPQYDHYKLNLSPLSSFPVYAGADLAINITNINAFNAANTNNFKAYIKAGSTYTETDLGGGTPDCAAPVPCTVVGGGSPNAICWFPVLGYCSLTASYYIAVQRIPDGVSWYNYTISVTWLTKTITPLTVNSVKYDEITDAGFEKYYNFTTTGGVDEVSVAVYDVAGGDIHWGASQTYLVTSQTAGSNANCGYVIQCSAPYNDSCRDQYHFCPTPASTVITNWFVTVKADTRYPAALRNKNVISYVIAVNATNRNTFALTTPQFVTVGQVPQEKYDYYSFAVPSVIVNETFYIELYVDASEDEASLYRNYLNDGTLFAGALFNSSSGRCQDSDWSCRTNRTGTTGNRRCFLQIPTCKLIPSTTIYFSVYGIKSQYYGIPVSYTLFGGLSTPTVLKDGISYQDQTNTGSYVHYLYTYAPTDSTPGDGLLIEVTNIQQSQKTNVYLSFQGTLAGDCPCYQYDYSCLGVTPNSECLFDTVQLFGGAGCKGLQPGNIYISVYGVLDAGLPNIGYTVTITKYNWAGPINALVAGNYGSGYVSDSEYVYYMLDTSTITLTSYLVEFEVRFVEYIAQNDGESLTLYYMRDTLLSPTCANSCSTPKYNNPGYSYCKIVLQPCQFDKTKNWYLVVKGSGGTNKNRPIHYTIRANPVAVNATALVNSLPMPGSVIYGRISHYSYAVTSTTNKRLYVEMYVDKDFSRALEFKVNFQYFASSSQCYNYTGSCQVFPGGDNTVKCVYHIPNCQLYVGTYYFGVQAFSDFYDTPVPYTITVYEKPEVITVTSVASSGPLFQKLGPGEYQLYMFDGTSTLPGDIFYFEVDSVSHGNLSIVQSTNNPKGLCPCYGPSFPASAPTTTTPTNYALFSYGCAGANKFYWYIQPSVFFNHTYTAFSVALYLNSPAPATALIKGKSNAVNQTITTTQYTHRYYYIPQNTSLANSFVWVNFKSTNQTTTFASLYGNAGSQTNDKCGQAALNPSAATYNVLLTPCQHQLDRGNYYFDVTAQDNNSYVYYLWWDSVDPVPLAFNTSFNGSVPGTVDNTLTPQQPPQVFVLQPTMVVGSVLRIRITNFAGSGSNPVYLTTNNLYGAYCTCNPPTAIATLSAAGDVAIDQNSCDIGTGSPLTVYLVVGNGGNQNNYTVRWWVTPPTQFTLSAFPGTVITNGTLVAQSDYVFYKISVPASANPLYVDITMESTAWNSGSNFKMVMTTDGSVAVGNNCGTQIPSSTAGNLHLDECCLDTKNGMTLWLTIQALVNTPPQYNFTTKILSRSSTTNLNVNTPSGQLIVPSLGWSVTRITGLPSNSLAVLTITANATTAPGYYFNNMAFQNPGGATGTPSSCMTTGNQICNSNINCTYPVTCPSSGTYAVNYVNLDAAPAVNAYTALWTVYTPTVIPLNPASPKNYTIPAALVGLPTTTRIPFVLDLSSVTLDQNDVIWINITTISNITLTAWVSSDTTALCGGGNALCTASTTSCSYNPTSASVPNCPLGGSSKYYVGVVVPTTGGSFGIAGYTVLGTNRQTLQTGNNSFININNTQYYVYNNASALVSSLDVYFNSVNPAGTTLNYFAFSVCGSPTGSVATGNVKTRLYPCLMNTSPSNGKIYFTAAPATTPANYTITLTPSPVSLTALTVGGSPVYNAVDIDLVYNYYSLTLPIMKPYDTVTVTFTVACGSMLVYENWNSYAWPDAAPGGTHTPGACFRAAPTTADAASNPPTATFTYAYCSWGPDRSDRTIYYAVQGNFRGFTNLIQYSVVATLSNNAPTLVQLPLRQDYVHKGTASTNIIYWFETQTEAVGTQIYLRTTTPSAVKAISRVYNEWFEDSCVVDPVQSTYNEFSQATPPGWDNQVCTQVTINSVNVQQCLYMISPAEYRDGRYYIVLDPTLGMITTVTLYVWVERQGAVQVTNNWSSYGSLGLYHEYQYYAISTAGRNYVTIKMWNVTNGQASLWLPEYQTGDVNLVPGLLSGRSETLGAFFVTDTNDQFQVTTTDFLVVPLGVCYFCTPYIYVGVRADSFINTCLNCTLTYNIAFRFGSEMQIANDSTVCDQTNFNANETTYKLTYDWEDIWVVTNWSPSGEQIFQYDVQTSTQPLTFAFSESGPASFNSPTPGGDSCGYSSVPSQLVPAGNSFTWKWHCPFNQFHISVIKSQTAVASSYYLHPVVYPVTVIQLQMTQTYSAATACGTAPLYFKVTPATTSPAALLSITSTGLNGISYKWGSIPETGASPPCTGTTAYSANTPLCSQNGTLYLIATPTGPYSITVSATTATAPLLLSTPLHDFVYTGGRNVYAYTNTAATGSSLSFSVDPQWISQTLKFTISKGSLSYYCGGSTVWSGASGTAQGVPACDVVAGAVYYVVVEPTAACSTTNVIEYWLTVTAAPAVTTVALTNAAATTASTTTTTTTNYYTFTPTAGSFLSVRLRNVLSPVAVSSAVSLTVTYTAGNLAGLASDNCKWYTQTTLCTTYSLNAVPTAAQPRWCVAEVPPCAFSTNQLYGFDVSTTDNTVGHGYELTVTQQTFTALTSGAANGPNALNMDAAYYQITPAAVAAFGLKVVVTSGSVQVRVYTYCGAWDCNQYDQTFRCDSNEGECRLEFANAVSHPLKLNYYVKVSGIATFTITYLEKAANNFIAPLPSTYFCNPVVNYTTWSYKAPADRDAEAKRLYTKWTQNGAWNCPSAACLNALKQLACFYFFPASDPQGFLYDVCQTSCQYVYTTCGYNFTWAGFPEFDCYNHFYKAYPYCTGANPGCDGTGKKYDVCGVCGGTGSTCATTAATGGPSTGGPSTGGGSTTGLSSTTGGSGNTTATTSISTGATTSAKNTTTTGTGTTTTTTTTSKTTSTTSVGPTTTTSTTSVSAAFTVKPALIFVMFAVFVLLFLQF